MNVEIFLGFLGFLITAGFATMWLRLGRLEGKWNGTMNEWHATQEQWRALRRLCPLCPKEESHHSNPEGQHHDEEADNQ